MIEVRKLRNDEYRILGSIADGYTPDPAASIAIVAFDGERPVGRMLIVAPAHVEGTWIDASARFGSVGRRLFECAEREAEALGLKQLIAFSTCGEHDAYMHRLGFERMPWTVWKRRLTCQ